MIVADTNVLSEPLRRKPDERVLAWLAAHSEQIAITTIIVGELLYGAGRLPEGKRRDRLLSAIEELVAGAGDRILGYDQAAARRYGALRAGCEAVGRPVGVEDTMIAAICQAGEYLLATRNVSDFANADIEVINPWGSGDQL